MTEKIKASELTKYLSIEIKITGIKILAARLWMGTQLFKLGARIIGCSVRVD